MQRTEREIELLNRQLKSKAKRPRLRDEDRRRVMRRQRELRALLRARVTDMEQTLFAPLYAVLSNIRFAILPSIASPPKTGEDLNTR